MLKRLTLFTVSLIGVLVLNGSLLAQSNEIVLTISLGNTNVLNERVLQGFYDTHPGVRIERMSSRPGDMSYGGDAKSVSEIETVLDKAEEYFSRSDIVHVSMSNIYPFATRAGYVLDMTPYLQADSSTADDFYPVALKMYQWDGGLWALPMSLTPWFMSYDPTAFEAADHPLPDDTWTVDDYLEAGRALTEYGEDGTVTRFGFLTQDYSIIAPPLFGLRFYDDSTQSETPLLNDPEFVEVVSKMDAYSREMNDKPSSEALSYQSPIQMGGLYLLTDEGGQTPYIPVSMSGEQAVVAGNGFAISAGTQHPQLAYEFIAYLATDIEAVSYFAGEVPARRSLEGQTAEGFAVPSSEVIDALLPRILEKGIPVSELRYFEYLYAAQMKMYGDETLSAQEALDEVQQEASDNLKFAEARRDEPLSILTPTPANQ